MAICTTVYAAAEPVISINGMTENVSINADTPMTLNVKLTPGEKDGTDADWWLLCQGFGKWYYYAPDGKWTETSDISTLRPAYQGRLFTISSTDFLKLPQLPAGNYALLFGVDMNMNGRVDKDSLAFSQIRLTVGSSSSQKSLKSDLSRNLSPNAAENDLKELVSGNNSFALDFYHAMGGEGNLFYSPYSISTALAMTYAGAVNETAQQMKDTLRFTLAQDRLHPALNALNLDLSGRTGTQNFELNIANSLWGQSDYLFLKSFLDVIAENYDTGLNRVDFKKSPEESRVVINNWVSEQTKEKINDLIPQGAIDEWTRLVLVNAIYFNAKWQNPFKKESTYDDTFYLADGSQIKTPTMHSTSYFKYTEGDGYKAVELPYKSGNMSMVILLPDAEKFKAVETSLTADRLNEITAKLKSINLILTMPKFRYTSDSVSLKKTLSDMGMPIAFIYPYADFSGMDGIRCNSSDINECLYIGDVIHKAFISVDEAGTEAAAATAVIMVGGSSAPPPSPPEMKINRPFIFFIRDMKTGAILFMGRIMNPAIK
jgi:serpin B